jgi:hypothetical protein
LDIIRACKITDSIIHGRLRSVLRDVVEGYRVCGDFAREEGPLGQHRLRLAEIAKLAKRLGPLIEAEPLMEQILAEPIKLQELFDGSEPFAVASRKRHLVCDALGKMERYASQIAKDEQKLLRSKNFGLSPRKSIERGYVWEPIFKFWMSTGRELGYSHDGPIMRVLNVIHTGLEIDPPIAASVRHAIKDFKGQ